MIEKWWRFESITAHARSVMVHVHVLVLDDSDVFPVLVPVASPGSWYHRDGAQTIQAIRVHDALRVPSSIVCIVVVIFMYRIGPDSSLATRIGTSDHERVLCQSMQSLIGTRGVRAHDRLRIVDHAKQLADDERRSACCVRRACTWRALPVGRLGAGRHASRPGPSRSRIRSMGCATPRHSTPAARPASRDRRRRTVMTRFCDHGHIRVDR